MNQKLCFKLTLCTPSKVNVGIIPNVKIIRSITAPASVRMPERRGTVIHTIKEMRIANHINIDKRLSKANKNIELVLHSSRL